MAVIGTIIAFGIHYVQIQNQPEAVFSGLLAVIATAFITFEFYRSSDTRDIKATVAAIRLEQLGGDGSTADADGWVTEERERVTSQKTEKEQSND